MKLQRFVIGFILGSSLTVLVAGLWFHRPAAALVKTTPTTLSVMMPASPKPSASLLSPGASDSVLAAQR